MSILGARRADGFIRSYSRGRGRERYRFRALCSACHSRVAHWLAKQGNYQRYYCDECVKTTAAYKARKDGAK